MKPITYKEIAETLEAFDLVPYYITCWKKINGQREKEVEAIETYIPKVCKNEALEGFRHVFAGDGVVINYIDNPEVMRFEIPNITQVVNPINYEHHLIKTKN